MKDKIIKTLNKELDLEEVASWAAFTYVAALYMTIISAQSYTVFIENLLS
ncbi:MAG: hypothetical protein WCG01_01230 [bacterium]